MLLGEQLILEVEKRPCIWQVSHDSYMKREVKDKAWEEICQILFPGLDSEKQVRELKKKWTNIRDSYRRYKRDEKEFKSEDPCSRRKKYVYAEILQFLDPIFESRSLERNYIDCTESKYMISNPSEDSSLVPPDESYCSVNLSQPAIRLRKNRRRKKQKTLEREIWETLIRSETANSEEDSDRSFLLSFLPDMRSLDEIQKIRFKRGMLDLIENIKFVPTSANPTPQST